jgi:hypothetical protein
MQGEGKTLEQRLAAARRDVEMWHEISNKPGLTTRAASAAHRLRRTTKARVALLEKAIAWQKTPREQRYSVHQQALARLLRVPLNDPAWSFYSRCDKLR